MLSRTCLREAVARRRPFMPPQPREIASPLAMRTANPTRLEGPPAAASARHRRPRGETGRQVRPPEGPARCCGGVAGRAVTPSTASLTNTGVIAWRQRHPKLCSLRGREDRAAAAARVKYIETVTKSMPALAEYDHSPRSPRPWRRPAPHGRAPAAHSQPARPAPAGRAPGGRRGSVGSPTTWGCASIARGRSSSD